MFQKSIVKKYLRTHLDPAKTGELYKEYTATFHNPEKIRHIRDSKEEQYQEGFLRDLFCAILGYTINPEPNYNLITEKKNDSDSRKADGAIIIEGRVQAVIELKGCDTTDLSKVENQAFGYKAHNPAAHLVIISNFEKLRLYIEDASDFLEFNIFTMSREDFGLLCLCLSLENLVAQVALRLKKESLSEEISITDKLYADYSTFKRALFDDICKNNAPTETTGAPEGALGKLVLFRKTQKLLDRILFILFAEDRGLLPENSILTIIEQWQKLKELDAYQPLYSRFLNYFDRINTGYKSETNPGYVIFAYNGGLFSKDEILDTIRISDDILYLHTKRLSEYDFESEVSVDILGHIFEHSLSEIEEMQEEIVNSSDDKALKSPSNKPNTTSKRKKDGVFYTPAYITKYIVESTIGRLCDAKKAELGINDEAFAQKRRNKNQRAELSEKLKAYRHWLLSLKICDPACGSGAFLNAALQFLKAEHVLVDELNAKLHGDTLIFQEVENSILENNLYGVDINEESVEIARLSLWLHTAQRGRKLSTLSNNIKCGNSLIDDPQVAGEKAFCWEKEFPEVFGSSGFDVVIGNPPYVFAREKMGEEEKGFYAQNYASAKYQVNTYILFMEKAVKLSKPNGTIGLIVPNSWLMTYSGEALRKFFLDNVTFYKIINLLGKTFTDAEVETVIALLENKKSSNVSVIEIMENKDSTSEFVPLLTKKQCELQNDKGCEFIIFSDEQSNAILSKMKENSLGLDEVASVKAGLQAYEKNKGNPKQTEEDVKKRPYDYTYKFDENTYKYLDGADVLRYGVKWSGLWLRYGDFLAAPRTFNLFSDEKIIVREITGSFPKCINAAYSEEIYLYNRSNIAVVKREGSEVSLKYILALLNSSLMSYYFKKNTAKAERKLFPKIILNDLRLFPIKNISPEEQLPFTTLADKMLALNADLQKSIRRFLKRVQDNLNPAKVSAALDNFYTMEFADFVRELTKQKVRLSLKQQDEWEDYFAEYKADCLALAQEIAATDNQINRLAYQLYGLTDEEIAVVEGS